jgi:hypothetical protein
MASAAPFTLSAEPKYPQPNSSVRVSALSASINLANATMDVTVGGSSLYRGAVRAVEVPLGAAGTQTTAHVTITANGERYSQSISVRPQDVVLVSEPRASAPALYPGKPAEPLDGNVRLVAVAGFRDGSGRTADASALSYAWTVDGAVQADASGIGKNAIIVATPLQYRDRTVSVIVQSQDGALVSGASLSLAPHEPIVRLYENDPLLGIRFGRALSSSYVITDAESSLYAGLYGFPTMVGTPSVNWYLNGESAQTGNTITLRPTGSGQGSASLSLVAAVGDTVRATANLLLSFGGASKTNFFGL